jgi:hypothetical protein
MANLTATLYITLKTKAGKWTTVKRSSPPCPTMVG